MFNARNYAHAISVAGLSLLLFAVAHSPADASDSPILGLDVPSVTAAAATHELATTPVTITFEGKDSNYTTEAKTFGDFLAEIGFHVGADDYLSEDASTPLTDGTRAEYRAAVPLTILYGKRTYALHTSAITLDEAVANARIGIDSRDVFSKDRRSLPHGGEIVRISHARPTVAHVAARAPKRLTHVANRKARRVALVGPARVAIPRPARRSKSTWHRHVVATPIVATAPRSALSIVAPISHLASSGMSAAAHLAGSVLHVIATAYIAGCYKCSGITANGMHAGFGIIAVDPHLIPLGTHLMIPGYGRAIAGDTGGAIIGNRVDLGMNTLAEAIRFGRRPMTVYVLK